MLLACTRLNVLARHHSGGIGLYHVGLQFRALGDDLRGTDVEVAAHLGIVGARLESIAERESPGRRPVGS